MMAEGNETTGEEPGSGGVPGGPDAPRRLSEGDLLAERRARRATDSGEVALTRRAEAAEATVQTLERHVSSLQERLREAEEELERVAEALDIERAAALEREHELRRAKQREYAEQQLRVEAESRVSGLDRESRSGGERIAAGEEQARDLAARIEQLERRLAEAERGAAVERAQVLRAEQELTERIVALEDRALQMRQDLDTERAARERSERELELMRDGHGQLERLLGEMRGILARLAAAVAGEHRAPSRAAPSAGASTPTGPSRADLEPSGEPRGAEMADALAAAVERLRVRADASQTGLPDSVESRPTSRTHKHSLSLIGRLRLRRKQRRSR